MLGTRDEKGVTTREYLEQRQKTTGKRAKELDLPPFPNVVEHIWLWFIDLHRGRSYGMNGEEPLRWVDIQAWCNLRQKTLQSWEIDMIFELDRLWIRTTQGKTNG